MRLDALISVIIPSYNYGRFVGEAVDSALAQTYRPIEIIVVDDGSKDITAEVMQAYADNPLVRYIRQENKGLPGARNTGILAATGKYLALLDADDVWEPEKIEQQVAFYEEHADAAIVATDSYEFESDHRPQTTDRRPQTTASFLHTSFAADSSSVSSNSAFIPHPSSFTSYSLRDLMEFSPFRPSSVIMRKDLCERAGLFDEELKYVEDLDMWARMASHGPIYRLNSQLTGFRNHPAVQSMHLGPHIEYHHRTLDKLFNTVPELRAHPHWRRLAEARLLVHLSWMRYCAGDRAGAVRDTLTSILNWPLALRNNRREKQRWHRAKRLVRYALFPPPRDVRPKT